MNPKERVDKKMDCTDSLPDECLALIFSYLTTKDRNNTSLVSHRWLRIDAQTRTSLTLNRARTDLQHFIPLFFTRFNSLTKLVLVHSPSINNDAMILITSMCQNLTRLKLIECRNITDSGIAVFSRKCKKLKEFSCVCMFADYGLAELLDNCSQLEVLSVYGLSTPGSVGDPMKLRAGAAAKSLKVIELTYIFSERLFVRLISACKNLKSLKVTRCQGKWDRVLEMIPDENCLAEVHLDLVNLTDVGVSSLAKCHDLTSLYIEDSRCTTHVGVSSMNEIGDEVLIAVGKHIVTLKELVLQWVNATRVSLEVIATNCRNLVKLELRWCETITDSEMMCIAEKCVALRTLVIEVCGVSNKGIEAFALGCPNLAEIKVTKCNKVTLEVKDRLIARRGGKFECEICEWDYW